MLSFATRHKDNGGNHPHPHEDSFQIKLPARDTIGKFALRNKGKMEISALTKIRDIDANYSYR